MFNLKRNKKNKGFTLIEILLVVGFIALAGIGVYFVYEKIETTNKVNNEARSIQALGAGIRNLYAPAGKYSLMNQYVLFNAKIAPDMTGKVMAGRPAREVNTLVNTFGRELDIIPIDYGSVPAGSNNGFRIGSTVPKELCGKLSAALAPSFHKVRVGGTTGVLVKDSENNINTINVADAVNACENGPSGSAPVGYASIILETK